MEGFKRIIPKIMIFGGVSIAGLSIILGFSSMDSMLGSAIGIMILVMGSCLGLTVSGIGIIADHLNEIKGVNGGIANQNTYSTNNTYNANANANGEWTCPRCGSVNHNRFCSNCRYEKIM